MPETSWYPFDNGVTLGQPGSEGGAIVRDDEYPLGARITLERAAHIAPFAITCGIYDCMMHTRFFAGETEAALEYERMKEALSAILERAGDVEVADEDKDARRKEFFDGMEAFVRNFP